MSETPTAAASDDENPAVPIPPTGEPEVDETAAPPPAFGTERIDDSDEPDPTEDAVSEPLPEGETSTTDETGENDRERPPRRQETDAG